MHLAIYCTCKQRQGHNLKYKHINSHNVGLVKGLSLRNALCSSHHDNTLSRLPWKLVATIQLRVPMRVVRQPSDDLYVQQAPTAVNKPAVVSLNNNLYCCDLCMQWAAEIIPFIQFGKNLNSTLNHDLIMMSFWSTCNELGINCFPPKKLFNISIWNNTFEAWREAEKSGRTQKNLITFTYFCNGCLKLSF